jgi:hypothetical protein
MKLRHLQSAIPCQMPTLLIARFSGLLNELGIKHIANQEDSDIVCWMEHEVGCVSVRAHILEATEEIIIFIELERHCPKQLQQRMIDLCNRINWRINIGFFAMDPNDGEVRFRHAVDISGVTFKKEFVDNLIRGSTRIFFEFYQALQDLMCGTEVRDPSDGFRKVLFPGIAPEDWKRYVRRGVREKGRDSEIGPDGDESHITWRKEGGCCSVS